MITGSPRSAGPTVPLPDGFGIVFDAETQFVGDDVLFGGSPPRLMRLNAAGAAALRELRAEGRVRSSPGGRLARRLTDTGMAHPRPPAGPAPGPDQVTVVIPVKDRHAELDRCLAALGAAYPVLVVDDGSRDPAAIATLCGRHGARLHRRPVSGGPGPARNAGLTGQFADPMVGAVAPRVRPVTGPGAAGRYLNARAPIDLGPRESRVAPLTRLSYVPTAALLA